MLQSRLTDGETSLRNLFCWLDRLVAIVARVFNASQEVVYLIFIVEILVAIAERRATKEKRPGRRSLPDQDRLLQYRPWMAPVAGDL